MKTSTCSPSAWWRTCPPGERLYPEDYLTDQPERFFVAEMVREQILRQTREEIPYSTGVVIESFKEGEPVVRIEATILAERDTQKAILIGKGGSMLKAIGTAARREIEAFLGTKVFLGLFVKVRERWREDPAVLEEMGPGQARVTACGDRDAAQSARSRCYGTKVSLPTTVKPPMSSSP